VEETKINRNDDDDDESDNNIFIRYGIIAVLLSAVAIMILVKAFNVGIGEKKEWLAVAKKNQTTADRKINPTRGNIFSDDDRLMATNQPLYYMYMDFGSEGFKKKDEKDGFAIDSLTKSKHNNIDSLSYWLSRKLKNRTQAGYKAHLQKGLKEKNRHYLIYEGKISFLDLKEIRQFPFLRIKGRNSFFSTREMMQRQKPFGTLASRTIGDIYSEVDEKTGLTKGKNGIELYYDSLLQGVAGLSSGIQVGGSWYRSIVIEPTDGMDIRSTIDINVQDIVEKVMTDKLKSLDAESGTAVVMEVKTGEIKAITNMARTSPGRYAETLNHAVVDELEPGSTFKVASMMVAIEDGLVQPSTPVDVKNGTKQVGKRTVTDHNANRGGYGLINAEKSIWYSSNIGVSELIYNAYRHNPTKYIEGLHRIGMDADLKIELIGAGKASLKWPSDKGKGGWSDLSLPTIPYGYEVKIPPIQTLAFFNAIANDGKMVKPLFVKDILKNGKSVKHFDSETIISKICSDETLKIMQNMLYNVVNYHDPTHKSPDGTGKPAKSEVITIAGKTGTAVRATGGVYRSDGYNVSFCGYFPYEHPEYTCIVVISRPRVGTASGGFMSGTVVKEIAEKVYAANTVLNIAKIKEDSLKIPYPDTKNGRYAALKKVTGALDVGMHAPEKIKSDYVLAHKNEKGVDIKDLPYIENLVPNVVGMGAKDAVFALENCGMRVLIAGAGEVVSQSVANGTKIVRGQTVTLTLK
jgi:cell division protein FtsI (penicillin-binding protein 3)